MAFDIEPLGYEKTILSDLQGAWQCLRAEVVDSPVLCNGGKILFHIDEATSWELVRDLRRMSRALLLVRNLIHQSDAPEGVLECLSDVDELMAETLAALNAGEI